jgi:ribonuclease P protein component
LERSTPHRFGIHNRLLNAAAFGRVFEKATRSRDKWFTVLCRENDDGPARLGLAISKKHCRKATARNRIKRTVRESFRQHQVTLSGLDIVVINKPAAAGAARGELSDSLENHWRQCRKATNSAGAQV